MLTLIGGVVVAVLDVVAIVDVLVSRRPVVEKLLWFVVILMLPLLGLLLYVLLGRSSRHHLMR